MAGREGIRLTPRIKRKASALWVRSRPDLESDIDYHDCPVSRLRWRGFLLLLFMPSPLAGSGGGQPNMQTETKTQHEQEGVSSMSFRCERCGKAVPNGVPASKIVTQTRHRSYPHSVGTEIVKELLVCTKCAKELEKK